MKRPLLAFLAAAVLPAAAETTFGVVDMDLVVLAHPQTTQNREELLGIQRQYIAERDEKLAVRDKMRAEFEAARKIALDPVQGEAARDQAAAKAKDLQMQYARATDEIEALVADRQRKLQRRELELFSDVLIDIRGKLADIARERKLDAVIDKTATRASMPIPVVLFASDAVDLTDAAIAAVGGSRERAEKDAAALLNRAGAILYGPTEPAAPDAAGGDAPAAGKPDSPDPVLGPRPDFK